MCIRNLLRCCAICFTTTAIVSIGMAPRSAAACAPKVKSKAGEGNAIERNLLDEHKAEYVTPDTPTIVNVAPATYLTMVGRGAPEGDEFRKKIGVMFGVAYGVKMKSKFTGKDFTIAPLEGLWWGNKDKHSFLDEPRETWNWKLLIRVPKFVTARDVTAAAQKAAWPGSGVKTVDIQLETLREGKCVQVLHVGPYATEAKTIGAMRAFAKKNGLRETGVHHEIYLSDPNSTPPEKLRTILRQPVK